MIVIFLSLITVIIYFLLKRRHSFWARRGIAQIEPEFLFGNVKQLILRNTTIHPIIKNTYNEFKRRKERHGGLYLLYNYLWIPVDVELIKRVMSTDCEYFDAHGWYHHERDPVTIHLFNLEGARWKALRAKLSTTFTSAKLKMMFDIVNTLGDRVENRVTALYEKGEPLEMKETMACYGTDVTATCFFGLDCNSLNEPENEFRKYGKLFFKPRNVRVFLEETFNWDLLSLFGHTFSDKKFINFFKQMAKDAITYREKNNISRKDYLELLIQLKNKGTIDDNGEIVRSGKEDGSLTFNEVVANMVVMYIAGFETSSTAISFLMYELAKHPDIQEKVRQEIYKILGNRSSKDLTYEDLAEMKYADMCLLETLRIYPPVPETPRRCTKRYTVPGTNQVIEKGTTVIIPAWSVHTDPEYYNEPFKFNPENFNTENKYSRPDFAFLGFGGGPKLCIGYRFAIMEVKVALVKLLTNYRYTLNPKTPQQLSFVPNVIVLTSQEDLLLDITPIN